VAADAPSNAALVIMSAVNAISEYLCEQAAAHRATAAEQPDDPRYELSAQALEALAAFAEAGAERDIFQMRYLLAHHVVDGRFAWDKGQSGRAIMQFGFDAPVGGEDHFDQFLMDLCDLAKSDAARHIGSNEGDFDRADAAEIAARFGIGVERVHSALDAGRGIRHVYTVGIPAWHEFGDAARAELEAIDGVMIAFGSQKEYGDEPPLLVKNVPAANEDGARERIAAIVAIEAGALGVAPSSHRVL
jgi:hypothetical protein